MFSFPSSAGRRHVLPTVVFVAVSLIATAVTCQTRGAVKCTDEKNGLRISSPYLEITTSRRQPAILSLAMDGLGLGKVGLSGLRAPTPAPAAYLVSRGEGDGKVWIDYRRQDAAASVAPGWRLEIGDRTIRMISQWSETEKPEPLVLQFEPWRCHATLLGRINQDGSVNLPAVMHLPSQGSFRITATGQPEADAGLRLRASSTTPFVKMTFPAATPQQPRVEYNWELTAIYPRLAGIEHDRRFDGFRRGWLNIFQMNPHFRVLTNNAASDTCAFCYYEYADMAVHTPALVEGVSCQ